jgi:hypothetical protein
MGGWVCPREGLDLVRKGKVTKGNTKKKKLLKVGKHKK